MNRRAAATAPGTRNRGGSYRISVVGLLALSVVTPLLYVTGRGGRSTDAQQNIKIGSNSGLRVSRESRRVYEDPNSDGVLEQIENLFPKEVLEVVTAKSNELVAEVQEAGRRNPTGLREQIQLSQEKRVIEKGDPASGALELPGREGLIENDPGRITRREGRLKRHEKRLTELTATDEDEQAHAEHAAVLKTRSRDVGGAVVGKYSAWKKEPESDGSDQLVRLMRDQLIMARGYMAIARQHNNVRLVRELKIRMKECSRALGEANVDIELPGSATERMRSMGQLLAKARDMHYDCTSMVKKLRAMVQNAEEQARMLKKQSTFLSQLAAKTVPKGLHCLTLRLNVEYYARPEPERVYPHQERLTDLNLYHYALFSDNILATAVVVNSTVMNAKDPEKHVFHLVTDKLNQVAFKAWFLDNSPRGATIEVLNVDDFKWLNETYCPVLKQLANAALREYYFKADRPATMAAGSSSLKYRNPKYLSMLNHLRFYLPEVFPALKKILFLDDDIVVQKDLTPLWDVDLKGNVNGAVETCGASFHRFDKYLNFSNPHISDNFDPQSCGWAYGMNMFDLVAWKEKDITGIYHKWQSMNEDRTLWKLGTLPPGLITFYNLTYPLAKQWHVLGLGYNPNLDMDEVNNAAVVHYNGNMKPWLEIGMSKFKPYWTKYVKYDQPYIQACNIND